MRKLILILGSLILFFSCSENELSYRQQIRASVKVYLDNKVKDEPNIKYRIDTLIISNITEKQEIEKEAFKYRDLALSTLSEMKELSIKFKDVKDLRNMMSELSNGKENAFTKSSNNDIGEMKVKFEQLQTKAKEYSKLAKKMAGKSLKADSTIVKFYDVMVKGIITIDDNVQKNVEFPFHISKDYKVIKEP